MGIILDFFRGDRSAEQTSASFDELIERVRPHFKPGLRLRNVADTTTSYLGGIPKLPQSTLWPEKDGRPLSFLASIDLSSVAKFALTPWLPKKGHLLFFYDVDEQPWGFDPKDRGSWAVIYTTEQNAESLGTAEPLPRIFVEFESFDSVPDWERFGSLGIDLNEVEVDTFIDGIYDNHDDELHQISGYPSTVQGDMMELECQLASNDVYVGDSSGYESEEGQALSVGAKDWRLLFQLSGDDEQGTMWGDCGRLYFWVKDQDARRCDFSNVWLVLQCS